MRRKDRDKDDGAEAAQASRSLIPLAASIASAYVARNQVPPTEVASFVQRLHATLAELARHAAVDRSDPSHKPAVPIKKSVGDDFLICLEDGKRVTMLKRYLRHRHNMSPEQYRAKWGLPGNYPMVAPAYARLRSAFAKKIGLGGKRPRRPTKRG